MNPLDFFFWAMLKEVYAVKIDDIDHLKQRITNESATIEGDTSLPHRVHPSFAKRVAVCTATGGNHKENVTD